MITLAIDSSSKTATAALIKDGALLGEITLNDKKEHSIILMTLIEDLLNFNKLTINDIDGYVVSKGPGSFTGLRIGMATIKGLSFGSGKPYVSVSSLDALAYNVVNFDGIICPIMDALRNSVYTALYKSDKNKLERLTDYSALELEELVNQLKDKNEKVIFIGDGVNKYRKYLEENYPNCTFPPAHLNLTRASSLGELGSILLESGQQDDPNSSPIYLKKSQAEREYEQRMQLKNEC